MANKFYKELNDTKAPRGITSPLTGPTLGRRDFFKLAGAGVAGAFVSTGMTSEALAASAISAVGPTLLNKARYCIFVLMTGAPSSLDTFDLKVGSWTPADFNPTSFNGTMFPQGLMPELAKQTNRFATVRSMRAPALVHPLQQTWAQIGRSPSSALGKVAPNIGSVVSLEFEPQRTASQKLPVFVSLNTNLNIVGSGYFNGLHAPFDVTAAPTGLGSLVSTDGQATFEARYNALKSIDTRLRSNSPLGDDATTMGSFYDRGKSMMYDPAVDAVFKFTTEEQIRYGGTSMVGQNTVNGTAFGNSCIVARNLVKSDQGTRFIHLRHDGWDHHDDIYDSTDATRLHGRAREFDLGMSALLNDLAASPGTRGGTLLDETLVVWMGEFGRTVGPLTGQNGRDHYFQHFACFAGAGVSGGKVIGTTSADGGYITDPGWSANRPAQYEDVAATVYSALGIDYTKILNDDPFGRGFEYVPFAAQGVWVPINDLFVRSNAPVRGPISPRDGGRRIG